MPPQPPDDQPHLPGIPLPTPTRASAHGDLPPADGTGFDPLDHDAVLSAMRDPASPLYYLPVSTCRWCGCALEELPSGPWVDDYGSQSCAVDRPGRHWPRID